MNRRRLTQDVSSPIALRFPLHPVEGIAGTSFKPEHLPAILDGPKTGGFFEVHAENYMGAGGPPHRALEAIRKDYPAARRVHVDRRPASIGQGASRTLSPAR
jgi:uncharacterized protein